MFTFWLVRRTPISVGRPASSSEAANEEEREKIDERNFGEQQQEQGEMLLVVFREDEEARKTREVGETIASAGNNLMNLFPPQPRQQPPADPTLLYPTASFVDSCQDEKILQKGVF
ncbi:OLC1v1035679C1 [Oldenlandia corymbosa var. corymbosa]|uniref:OLC1v1035679C1 n=1 Tax=Oldenlandia corymbosa var. corymbosa TaxID=529605 RepID=A0AAV1CVF0_OLDCO|nr:OLC1v1035679C1 [Oldenlandia corymbosa var. corymbosa]